MESGISGIICVLSRRCFNWMTNPNPYLAEMVGNRHFHPLPKSLFRVPGRDPGPPFENGFTESKCYAFRK